MIALCLLYNNYLIIEGFNSWRALFSTDQFHFWSIFTSSYCSQNYAHYKQFVVATFVKFTEPYHHHHLLCCKYQYWQKNEMCEDKEQKGETTSALTVDCTSMPCAILV